MTEATLRDNKLTDITFMGMRAAIGAVFIAHGVQKFGPGPAGWFESMGIPGGLASLVGVAEVGGGILLVLGIVSRISSAWLSILMLAAIFVVKGAANLIGERGTELDVIILAALMVIMIAGPGRVSIAHIIKRIPRIIH